MLLTEHNRIARALSKLNQHWDDVTLFLESKRIITAILQHITYTEFLTTVLGEVNFLFHHLTHIMDYCIDNSYHRW